MAGTSIAERKAGTTAVTEEFAGIFVRDTARVIAVLETILVKGEPVSDDDLKIYTVNVHGVKSALRTIKENKLSVSAAELEKAGREKNITKVFAETHILIKGLRTVMEKLKPKDSKDTEIMIDKNMAFIKENLILIKDACNSFDQKTARSILIRLKKKNWPLKLREQLNAMSEYLLAGDFETVSAAADKIMNNGQHIDSCSARVLVVDDFVTIQNAAAGILRKYNIQTDCVTSGQEAVDIIKCGEPVYSCIFMDRLMPEMDGIEAAQLIRCIDSEYARTIPIISMTSDLSKEDEKMFLEKGFNGFLSKPLTVLNVEPIINKWIRAFAK
ncbi:MAG: response regulator [Treponema sp.]|jgi:CheY-like chemotaxis protein/HPt (histidine-containing phosphotransfer) domain-containing protein|nr:response regulator [Treponema sp.]